MKTKLSKSVQALLLSSLINWFAIEILQIPQKCNASGNFWVKRDGQLLLNSSLYVLQGTTSIECLLKCTSHGHCRSVNYSAKRTLCELNSMDSKNSTVVFEANDEWTYHEVLSPRAPNTIAGVLHGVALAPKTSGASCLEIRKQYGANAPPSGMYWTSGMEPLQMYCDMEVDGGGWTKVANMNITTENYRYSRSNIQDDVKSLNQTESPYYALSTAGLAQLRQLINFTTIRIYCKKRSVNRTIHIVTASNSSGLAVVDYMTTNSSRKASSCGSYVKFQDDDSIISGSCSSWYSASWSIQWMEVPLRLYAYPAFINTMRHINTGHGGRFECDDTYEEFNGKIGLWMFFVR